MSRTAVQRSCNWLFRKEAVERSVEVIVRLKPDCLPVEVDDYIEALEEVVAERSVDVTLALHTFGQC